jgi:hypothetical protein
MTYENCKKCCGEYQIYDALSESIITERFCSYQDNCPLKISSINDNYCLNHPNPKRVKKAIEEGQLEKITHITHERKANILAILSEKSLARDWNKPEEDKAWKNL